MQEVDTTYCSDLVQKVLLREHVVLPHFFSFISFYRTDFKTPACTTSCVNAYEIF